MNNPTPAMRKHRLQAFIPFALLAFGVPVFAADAAVDAGAREAATSRAVSDVRYRLNPALFASQRAADAQRTGAQRLRVLRRLVGAAPAQRRGGLCGDGLPAPGEPCDDGNLIDGDGCSSTCSIEVPFACSEADGSSSLQDGGFELGGDLLAIDNPVWIETTNAELPGGTPFTPICAESVCLAGADPDFAVQGNNFLWFGSNVPATDGGVAVASVEQTLNLPAGLTSLSLYAFRQACAAGSGDNVTVTIDALPVFSLACDAVDTDWAQYTADISAFADDASHTLAITGVTTSGTSFSNIYVDFALTDDVAAAPSMCTNECGNGAPDGAEQCDDGNTDDGDGCSSLCMIEAGFECSDAIAGTLGDAVGDSSFELGGLGTGAGANPFWTEVPNGFLPLIRDGAAPGSLELAQSGDHYVWFGGVPNTGGVPAVQSLTQDVVFDPAATTLSISVLRSLCAPSPDGDGDGVSITLDGNTVFTLACDATEVVYQTYDIDLVTAPGGPYNDGLPHTLRVIGVASGVDADGGAAGGKDWTNIFIDDVTASNGMSVPPVPSVCNTVESCFVEDFNAGTGGDLGQLGWTTFNTGALALDWGTTDDGVCLSSGNSGNAPGSNMTGGDGEAACVDSDQAGSGLVDAWLCSPAVDLAEASAPTISALANYQVFSTPTAEDQFEIRAGAGAPDAVSVQGYDVLFGTGISLGSLFSAGGVELGGPLDVSHEYVCFHYVADFDWWAQVDDVSIRAQACSAEADTDEDGVADSADNCVNVANPDQLDVDGDQIGNLCDGDFDQNCSVDFVDLQLFKLVIFQNGSFAEDMDGNGMVDFVDLQLFKAEIFKNYSTENPSGISGNLCEAR